MGPEPNTLYDTTDTRTDCGDAAFYKALSYFTPLLCSTCNPDIGSTAQMSELYKKSLSHKIIRTLLCDFSTDPEPHFAETHHPSR